MSFLNTQQEFDTPGEALLHYGVKGMKWGVRKAYSDRRLKEAAGLRAVSKGNATRPAKLVTHLTTPLKDIREGGGLKGGARVRAEKLEAHVERINTGQTKVKDGLEIYGNLNVKDLVKGFDNRNG